jgi:uncharacterized protein YqeY
MLFENLQKEMIKAYKSGDMIRKNELSALIDLVKKAAIEKNCRDSITEEMVDNAISKEKKILEDMINKCPVSRNDLKAEYIAKLAIINEYAPVLLNNPDEIKALISESGLELTKANRGNIMKFLKGKCDMKTANQVVGTLLS